jgi:hypothetical protein
MTVSAVRWALVDTIHSCIGLPLPKLDFSRLGQNVDAYALLIEMRMPKSTGTGRMLRRLP